MPARSAAEVHQLWVDAFSRGDVDALLALYEDDAVLLAQPGAPLAHGTDAIRGALEAFLSLGATFEVQHTDVVAGGDLAILYSVWTLRGGADPEGDPIDMSGQTTDVVRRQPDGTWLFAIDNPYGVRAFAAAPASTS